MRTIAKTILMFLLVVNLKGQNKFIPLYFDEKIISSTVDSLLKAGVSEVVVLLSPHETDSLKIEKSLTNYICWSSSGQYHLKIITENTIYPTVSFRGQNIFTYKNKLNTLVKPVEQSLKMTPPLTTQNAVFYFTPGLKGYFELPDKRNPGPITYVASDKKKEAMRTAWFNIILETISHTNLSLQIPSNYDRYKDFR
ncbi:MAG: hypothetical protein JST26_07305 [Bacteroidetes bacterium]|nr:hypothetical protein [Bacteroidota bacterium]